MLLSKIKDHLTSMVLAGAIVGVVVFAYFALDALSEALRALVPE